MSTKVSSWVCSSAIVAARGWSVSHFLRVWWKRSTLPQVVGWLGVELIWVDAQPAEFVFERVASAFTPGKPGGEDHAVVGQGRGRNAMCGAGFAEGVQHDWAGDAAVRSHRQRVAGMIVEPVEDLHMGCIC
jgi:hypothetical protein